MSIFKTHGLPNKKPEDVFNPPVVTSALVTNAPPSLAVHSLTAGVALAGPADLVLAGSGRESLGPLAFQLQLGTIDAPKLDCLSLAFASHTSPQKKKGKRKQERQSRFG